MQNLVIPARSPSMPADNALVVAVVNPSNQTFIASYSFSNYILDPDFPVMDPSEHEYNNCVFGRRFVITVSTAFSICARRISNGELLRYYFVPIESFLPSIDAPNYALLLDDNLHYCIPFCLRSFLTNALTDHVGISDDLIYRESEVSDNLQCYQMKKSPTATDWTSAYFLDPSTNIILTALMMSPKPNWPHTILSTIDSKYRSHLLSNRIQLLHGKLVYISLSLKMSNILG